MHNVPVGLAKPALVDWHAHLDLAILTVKWLFVAGKMRGMFAMLLGAGAVLLTERIERRGQEGRTADIFLRRNMWLALFGLLHGTLIWEAISCWNMDSADCCFCSRCAMSRRASSWASD